MVAIKSQRTIRAQGKTTQLAGKTYHRISMQAME
jgi:hypothetical protein